MYNERSKHHGADKLKSTEEAHLSLTGSANSFMQSNIAYADEDGAQRTIIMGRQEMLAQLKKKGTQIHVDATFAVPVGFYQCLIIGVFGDHEAFLPCVYILMTRKNRLAYEVALSTLQTLLGGKIKPAYALTDFETAMYQSIQKFFPEAEVVGCFFHFVQALTRKMIKIGFSQEFAFREVKRFYLLCICEKDEVFDKAVPFLEMQIMMDDKGTWTTEEDNNWRKFFDYLKNQWDDEEKISLFNYSGRLNEM